MMKTRNLLAMATLSTLLAVASHSWAAQEADHSQHHPAPAASEAASAAPSHADKMETKMAKAELAVDRLTQKMAKVKETLDKARQATGDERNTLLNQHGEGLAEVLQGLREATLKMMSKEKMADMMGGGKAPGGEPSDKQAQGGMMGKGGMMGGGKAPGGEPSDKQAQGGMMGKGGGMMAGMEMEEHHRLMEKRLILLFDLMEQMLEHGKVASGSPR